jgi:hypothetical protein
MSVSEAADSLRQSMLRIFELAKKFSQADQLATLQANLVEYLSSARTDQSGNTASNYDKSKNSLQLNAGFPVVIAVLVPELQNMSIEQKKIMRELQFLLRSTALQFGGAVLDVGINDKVSVEKFRHYILHRLYPESIRMTLEMEVLWNCPLFASLWSYFGNVAKCWLQLYSGWIRF